MREDYPKRVARGIINDTLMQDNMPSAALFKNFETGSDRQDEYSELSINWCDCEDAVTLLLKMKREDAPVYKCGVAILSREEIDSLRRRPATRGFFSYERRPIPDNNYHGNLLLRNNVSKQMRDLIANGLALCVDEVIQRT